MTPIPIPQFDQTQAHAEGWRLLETLAGALEVELWPPEGPFKFDSESYAEMEVYHKARDGSEYHRQALELLWHSEERPHPHPLDTPGGRVIRKLNAGFAEAPTALKVLLADVDPALRVLGEEGFDVTPLGLLNGGLSAAGNFTVAACYQPDGEFLGFAPYVPPGVPDEHADYPFSAWRAAVAAKQTALGYDDWVTNTREDAAPTVPDNQEMFARLANPPQKEPETDWQGLAQDLGNSLEETADALRLVFAAGNLPTEPVRPGWEHPPQLSRARKALKVLDHALKTATA